MRSMGIERRRLLSALALGGLCAGLGPRASAQGRPRDGALYLAARKNGGHYEMALFDGRARDRLAVALPGRGHSFAIDGERRRCVVFGRQPGYFAMAVDLDREREPLVLDAAPGRHFYGHGVYAPDGRRLYATENDYEAGRGVVGVYDCAAGGGYRRVGEYPTGGVGPHEAVLLPDGRTLCVANGGILTHPDYGKLQLNADTMRPSLAYLDLATGELAEQVFLDDALNRLSIRHLVVDGAGHVWFACQYTGPGTRQPPLLGRHRRGRAAELYAAPGDTQRAMRNYIGSLAYDPHSGLVAATSPVGGVAVFWDAAGGRCVGACAVFDGCGVAAAPGGGFLISSGDGRLARAAPDNGFALADPVTRGVAWDNHLRRV